MPTSAWLGIAAILMGSGLGVGLTPTAGALALFFLRYALFLAPIAKGLDANTWAFAGLATLLFTVWEALPLWLAGAFGAWALKRRSIPGWALVLMVAALHLSLAAWVPRPYEFSWGAMFGHAMPGGIWLFGSDLLGGLALGWICLVVRVLMEERVAWRTLLLTAVAPVVLVGLGTMGYDSWCGAMIATPKNTETVIAVQGDLPPFAGGFVIEAKRALVPVVLYSMLKPDLVMFPEDMIQVADGLDPDSKDATLRRGYTATGTGVAAPYSQVLYGVRDWTTARAYFTDLVNGKPDVLYKDVEMRTPFVDHWPSMFTPIMEAHGFTGKHQIRPAEKTPTMGLMIHDDSQERGLRRVGTGLITLGNEVRDPLLVRKVRATPDAGALLNPNIGGWLGMGEARGADLQARARSIELGLLLYRAGQKANTGFFSPWENAAGDVQSVGPGILRFSGRVPVHGKATGYTAAFWTALYMAPAIFLMLLVVTLAIEFGWIEGWPAPGMLAGVGATLIAEPNPSQEISA